MKVRFVKPEFTTPDRDRGIRVPYAPAKRQLAKWRWYLILLVVSSPLLYFVTTYAYSSIVIEAPGQISPQQLTVRSQSTGYVDEIYVKPLDKVAEGDPLVRLNNLDLKVRAAELQAEMHKLASVAGNSDRYKSSSTDFQGSLEDAREQRDQQSHYLSMIEQLVSQGAATESELAAARNQYHQAADKVDDLYRQIKQENRPDNSKQEIQARMLAVRAELESVNAQIDGLLVRAPKSGRVADLQLIKGDQLSVGSQVAVITPAGSKCLISVYVPPAHPEYAEKGVQATVFFPDGMRGRAVVTDVPDVAREVPSTSGGFGNPEMGVLVRMTLEDPGHEIPKSLSDGLPVKVRFSNQPSLEAIRKLEHTAMNYLQDTRSDWENVWSSVSKRRT